MHASFLRRTRSINHPKVNPGSVWLLPALALGGLTHKGVHTAVNPLFLLIQGHHVLGDLAQEKAEVKESSLCWRAAPQCAVWAKCSVLVSLKDEYSSSTLTDIQKLLLSLTAKSLLILNIHIHKDWAYSLYWMKPKFKLIITLQGEAMDI